MGVGCPPPPPPHCPPPVQKRATASASAAKITAEGEAQATMIKAQAEATSISVRATADAERICRLNDAMRTASESVVRRELLEAAGRIMAQTTTNTVVSENPVGAIMAMLTSGGGAGLLQGGKH